MLETLNDVRKSPFSFLLSEPLPPHLANAMKFYGLKEITGEASNPVIMQFAKELGVDAVYKNDDMAWCAVFAGVMLKRAGEQIPAGYDSMRALKYAYYGEPQRRAALGDVLVLQRDGGGHVCFYVGEDAQNFFVLGGNQKNMVCIIPIEKNRVTAIRRTQWVCSRQPPNVTPRPIDFNAPVSKNEA